MFFAELVVNFFAELVNWHRSWCYYLPFNNVDRLLSYQGSPMPNKPFKSDDDDDDDDVDIDDYGDNDDDDGG